MNVTCRVCALRALVQFVSHDLFFICYDALPVENVNSTCRYNNFLSFVKQWGQTAIYKASAKGDTETVKVLLQAKADTEIQHTVTAFFSRQKECSCWQNNFSFF